MASNMSNLAPYDRIKATVIDGAATFIFRTMAAPDRDQRRGDAADVSGLTYEQIQRYACDRFGINPRFASEIEVVRYGEKEE